MCCSLTALSRMILFLVACSLCHCITMAANDFCTFPETLVHKGVWYLQVQNQGLRTGHIIEFIDQYSIMWYNHSAIFATETQWNCLNNHEDYFVMSSTDQFTVMTTYICVSFEKKAEYVYQVYMGKYGINDRCGSMELYPWLMVYLDYRNKHEDCLLIGGFNFDIIEQGNKEMLCKDFWLKPFMESDCMRGDEIHVDFRIQECKGSLRMKRKQNLQCLGAWSEEDLTHIVLIDDRNQDLFKPIWLLIINTPDLTSINMTGTLLFDLRTVNYSNSNSSRPGYQLTLTRASFPSVCEDEAISCLQCSGIRSYYCKKSCGICSASSEPKNCLFDSSVSGTWLQYTADSVEPITVSGSEVNHYDWDIMKCKKLNGTELLSFMYVVESSHTNGCKHRYTCVNLRKISDSVILYRMSKTTVITYESDYLFPNICNEDVFVDDFAPLGDKYRSKNKKFLISASKRIPTSCLLPANSLELQTYSSGCSAILSVCDTNLVFQPDTVLELKSTSENCTFSTKYLRCLANVPIDAYRVIIVDDIDRDVKSIGFGWCLILQQDTQINNKVMLMPAAQCDVSYMLETNANLLPHFIMCFQVSNISNLQNQCEPPIKPSLRTTYDMMSLPTQNSAWITTRTSDSTDSSGDDETIQAMDSDISDYTFKNTLTPGDITKATYDLTTLITRTEAETQRETQTQAQTQTQTKTDTKTQTIALVKAESKKILAATSTLGSDTTDLPKHTTRRTRIKTLRTTQLLWISTDGNMPNSPELEDKQAETDTNPTIPEAVYESTLNNKLLETTVTVWNMPQGVNSGDILIYAWTIYSCIFLSLITYI